MSESSNDQREESGAHHLAALLRRSNTTIVDDEHDSREWLRLRDGVRALRAKQASKGFRPRVWWLAPVAAGLLLGSALWYVQRPTLVCRVDGRKVDSPYFAADKSKPLDLDFSDGSSVRLSQESQLRLASPRASGAILQLERGEVSVAIRHHRDTRWQLDAGPYTVKITGTRFRASWDPVHGVFNVSLLEGSVTITGAPLAAALPLAVGQELHATRAGSVAIRSSQAAPSQPAAPTLEPEPTAALLDRPSSPVETPSSTHKTACDFSQLLTQGRFQTIITQAKGLGLRHVFADCPVSELFALSDAARYLGSLGLSADTLAAIRRRSPENADKATFFLGRLEEIRGRPELACKWYSLVRDSDEVYSAEARMAKQRLEGKSSNGKGGPRP